MSERTDNFYNNISFLYPVIDLFLKPQKRKLIQEIDTLPLGKLLEVGVGNGTHLSYYKKHKITGIDTSVKMLEIAKKQELDNLKLIQMNGENLLFPDQSFDYIIISHVISVTKNPEKLLKESYRVLKPGGKVFILNHFTPNNWLKYVDKTFDYFSKIVHFKSYFKISNLATIDKFQLSKEIKIGSFSYFKLLIYDKS